MLQFLSKESEVGNTLLKYLQLKKDFHEATAIHKLVRIDFFTHWPMAANTRQKTLVSAVSEGY